jgi:hypothetical protein
MEIINIYTRAGTKKNILEYSSRYQEKNIHHEVSVQQRKKEYTCKGSV